MAQTIGQATALLLFVVAVGWVLLLIVLQRRLFRAYIAHYGDRRRRWQRWFGWPPDGRIWWTSEFYFTRYDDPVVERIRRRLLLAWLVPLGIVFVFAIARFVIGE